ncbi:MAG: bacterial Ig-like domain-containing protein [Clostridia bacterium]|nr:bacterial Ig-like domain-containing protein [Clostridia bacterium]
MRKKKLWITIGLMCCGMLMFAACKEDRAAQSIALNDYSAETPLEVSMGGFSYSNYTVTITYDNGETEAITLTEEMISETDKLKFYQEGKNDITITHKGVSTTVSINVYRKEFSENVQLNDVTTTYTGEAFTVEVEGDLPGGTKILYPQGNVFQSAGSYDMTAVLQCEGYVTKTLSARIVIGRATYDLSNAQLYDESVADVKVLPKAISIIQHKL